MFQEFGKSNAGAAEIRRLKSQWSGKDVIVPVEWALPAYERPGRELIGPVCKIIWTRKTAAIVAALAGKDARTGARWLSGEVEPPPIIYAAIHVALTRW